MCEYLSRNTCYGLPGKCGISEQGMRTESLLVGHQVHHGKEGDEDLVFHVKKVSNHKTGHTWTSSNTNTIHIEVGVKVGFEAVGIGGKASATLKFDRFWEGPWTTETMQSKEETVRLSEWPIVRLSFTRRRIASRCGQTLRSSLDRSQL